MLWKTVILQKPKTLSFSRDGVTSVTPFPLIFYLHILTFKVSLLYLNQTECVLDRLSRTDIHSVMNNIATINDAMTRHLDDESHVPEKIAPSI